MQSARIGADGRCVDRAGSYAVDCGCQSHDLRLLGGHNQQVLSSQSDWLVVTSTIDEADSQAALARFFVFIMHIQACRAHCLDHFIKRDRVLAVAL